MSDVLEQLASITKNNVLNARVTWNDVTRTKLLPLI